MPLLPGSYNVVMLVRLRRWTVIYGTLTHYWWYCDGSRLLLDCRLVTHLLQLLHRAGLFIYSDCRMPLLLFTTLLLMHAQRIDDIVAIIDWPNYSVPLWRMTQFIVDLDIWNDCDTFPWVVIDRVLVSIIDGLLLLTVIYYLPSCCTCVVALLIPIVLLVTLPFVVSLVVIVAVCLLIVYWCGYCTVIVLCIRCYYCCYCSFIVIVFTQLLLLLYYYYCFVIVIVIDSHCYVVIVVHCYC